MVSMGVSTLGPMDLIVIDVRVKINDAYYRELLLTQKLLQVRQPGTRCQTISAIRRLAKTLLGDC